MSPLLWLCFTLSGAAALALELLWMRSAGLVLGQTAITTATVLACYFAGLGIGAAAGRRGHRDALRVYGWLELAAAAGAVWSVSVFRLLAADDLQHWLNTGGVVVRIAAVVAAVLPATTCLGATLPALGQVLATGAPGSRGGWLYSLNTLGGAVGIAAAGFWLPAAIGVTASYAAAATTSALAGAIALLVARRRAPVLAPPANASHGSRPAPRWRLRVVAAGAGALGLGLEVLWTRLFAQVLHNSVYSFSAIALVFLVALAVGSGIAAMLLRRLDATALATGALTAAPLGLVAGLWLFTQRTDDLAYVGMKSGIIEYVGHIVTLAALSVGPAAAASGLVLPALWDAWGATESAALPLGDLSAASTFGGVLGALAAGFLGIPILGLRGSLLVAGLAYVVLANLLAPRSWRWRPLAFAAVLSVIVFNPMRVPLVHLRPPGDGHEAERLRATVEGPSGIVTVVETDDDLQLRLDNYYVLGDSAAAVNERRLGVVPLLLHPAPRRVLLIGLATGISASAGPALGVPETTVVELVPEVATAARAHFASWNANLSERDDVRVLIDDGRRYLAGSDQTFDVVVSDLFIPWHAGAGNLYAREMYDTVARRLSPGGLFCQWLPLYQLTREEFDMIARTFLSVFPEVSLWRADFYPNRAVVGLVGQRTSQPVDLARVGERLATMPAWSRDPLLTTSRGLVMLSAGPLTPVADWFAAAALNTYDRPRLEFLAPRLTRVTASGDKDWFTGEPLAEFYETLATRTAKEPDPLLPASDDVRDARRAGLLLYRYAVAAQAHDTSAAVQLEAQVRTLVPEVIEHAEDASDTTDLATARRTLDELRAQYDEVQRRLDEMKRRVGRLDRIEGDGQ